MAFEGHARLGQLAQFGKAHDLKATTIGQDRLFPVHEFMEPAEAINPLGCRAQHQMICIAQQNIGTRGSDTFRHHRLDGRGSAHRHESRRANIAPRRGYLATAGFAVGGVQRK